MGWNSWDCYGASVTESEVLGNAEYMAQHLQPYGWDYVVVDIQWYEPGATGSRYRPFVPLRMDDYGRLIPAANRFPSACDGRGFRPLSDRIHGLGLKFGIHILRGIPRQAVHAATPVLGQAGLTARDIAATNSICPWNTDMYGLDPSRPGAQAYYDSIFQLYAQWGVDFVKVDDVFSPRLYGYHRSEVEMIHRAVERSGRDMVLSLSHPSLLSEALHLQQHATMWRITGDFWDEWDQLRDMFDQLAAWAGFQRNGAYPDADMLPLGHIALRSTEHHVGDRWTRFTRDEQVTMMSLWSIARSPLMVGCELRDTDDWTLKLLTNREVWEMLRNTFGNHEIARSGDGVIWMARHTDGRSLYLALFNWSEGERTLRVPEGVLDPRYAVVDVLDVWTHANETRHVQDLAAPVAPHGAVVWRITPER